jgi:hypothetical protein
MFAPNSMVREKVKSLRQAYLSEFGSPSLPNRLKAQMLVGIGAGSWFRNRLVRERAIQPKSEVYTYKGAGVEIL